MVKVPAPTEGCDWICHQVLQKFPSNGAETHVLSGKRPTPKEDAMEMLKLAIAAACVTLVTACSQDPVPTVPTVESVQVADPGGTQAAANMVADNLPFFGSLTQSSNSGSVPGITGDRASAAFDGQNLDLTIQRQDGSSIQLNTADNALQSIPGTYTGIPGLDRRRDIVMARIADNAVSAAVTYVNWNDSDPLDYLAAGYWMHYDFEGDASGFTVTGTEIGAFVDGPELDGSTSLPVDRTASYLEATQGFYVQNRNARTDIGAFTAIFELTANFGSNRVSGCVGCTGSIELSSFEDDSISESDTMLRLGPAPIGSDGSFRNQEVTLVTPGMTYSENSGSWGGKLSNVPDAAGDPRLVAGTYGAKAATAGGDGITFVGAFYAGKREQ